jgi:pyruvate dehydrogenase (quinone)
MTAAPGSISALSATWLVMPPKMEAEHALGLSLYVAKAIINGRSTELVELARTILFR